MAKMMRYQVIFVVIVLVIMVFPTNNREQIRELEMNNDSFVNSNNSTSEEEVFLTHGGEEEVELFSSEKSGPVQFNWTVVEMIMTDQIQFFNFTHRGTTFHLEVYYPENECTIQDLQSDNFLCVAGGGIVPSDGEYWDLNKTWSFAYGVNAGQLDVCHFTMQFYNFETFVIVVDYTSLDEGRKSRLEPGPDGYIVFDQDFDNDGLVQAVPWTGGITGATFLGAYGTQTPQQETKPLLRIMVVDIYQGGNSLLQKKVKKMIREFESTYGNQLNVRLSLEWWDSLQNSLPPIVGGGDDQTCTDYFSSGTTDWHKLKFANGPVSFRNEDQWNNRKAISPNLRGAHYELVIYINDKLGSTPSTHGCVNMGVGVGSAVTSSHDFALWIDDISNFQQSKSRFLHFIGHALGGEHSLVSQTTPWYQIWNKKYTIMHVSAMSGTSKLDLSKMRFSSNNVAWMKNPTNLKSNVNLPYLRTTFSGPTIQNMPSIQRTINGDQTEFKLSDIFVDWVQNPYWGSHNCEPFFRTNWVIEVKQNGANSSTYYESFHAIQSENSKGWDYWQGYLRPQNGKQVSSGSEIIYQSGWSDENPPFEAQPATGKRHPSFGNGAPYTTGYHAQPRVCLSMASSQVGLPSGIEAYHPYMSYNEKPVWVFYPEINFKPVSPNPPSAYIFAQDWKLSIYLK